MPLLAYVGENRIIDGPGAHRAGLRFNPQFRRPRRCRGLGGQQGVDGPRWASEVLEAGEGAASGDKIKRAKGTLNAKSKRDGASSQWYGRLPSQSGIPEDTQGTPRSPCDATLPSSDSCSLGPFEGSSQKRPLPAKSAREQKEKHRLPSCSFAPLVMTTSTMNSWGHLVAPTRTTDDHRRTYRSRASCPPSSPRRPVLLGLVRRGDPGEPVGQHHPRPADRTGRIAVAGRSGRAVPPRCC